MFVNPMHVKRTRELDDSHPDKTDIKDPKTIANLVIFEKYLEPYIPEYMYTELRVVKELRLCITKELNSIMIRELFTCQNIK